MIELNKDSKDLFSFMVNQMGGEGRVRTAFLEKKISATSNSPLTMKQLLEEARSEGWIDWLSSLKFSSFRDLFLEETRASQPKGQAGSFKRGRRMTGKEKEALHEAILEYLASHLWSYGADVAEHVGLPSRPVGLQLRALREAGKIKTEGEKAKMRYALKD